LVNCGDWRKSFIPQKIFSELKFFVIAWRAFPRMTSKFKFWSFEWRNSGKWLFDDFWRVIKWCLNFLFGLSEMRNTAFEDRVVAVKSLFQSTRIHIEFWLVSYSWLTISASNFWGVLLSSWVWVHQYVVECLKTLNNFLLKLMPEFFLLVSWIHILNFIQTQILTWKIWFRVQLAFSSTLKITLLLWLGMGFYNYAFAKFKQQVVFFKQARSDFNGCPSFTAISTR